MRLPEKPAEQVYPGEGSAARVELWCPTCRSVTQQERWLDRQRSGQLAVDVFCVACTQWRPLGDPLVESIRIRRYRGV